MPDVTRIIEQTATESIYNDDWFLKDSATNGTTKILASKLKELLCGDYIADEWVAGETYTNGAIVSHEGKLYYNSTGASLTQSTFDANAWLEVKIDELLEKVIGSVGEKWRRVDTYCYDDLVVYGGRLYRCIKNASTQGTWVSNEWIEANAEYYFKKVREYIARYGFIPSREAVSSPYNKGDLILYGAPGDTTNSLYMRLNDTKYGDPTWIPENWLKVGNIGGALSKIYDDIEESSCDVQIKEQSIVDENRVADLTSLAAVGSASGAIATFTDGSDLSMPKLEVAIDPIQDLHGYDSPWVGGAGKNKLQVTGTTQTINGVTFTVNNDGTIIVNGTATADARFVIGEYILKAGSSVSLNGSPVDGSTSTIALGYQGYGIVSTANSDRVCDRTSQSTDWDNDVYIAVTSGYTANNLVFKPMIRLSTVSDATFAPYSNICPISGHTETNVTRCGKNLVEDVISGWYITANGTFNVGSNYDMQIARVMKGQTYTVTSNEGLVAGFFVNKPTSSSTSYNGSRVDAPNKTFIAPIDGYVAFRTEHNYATPQCELGSTATAYEPYNGQTYTIDLDGTHYGGTLDVTTGVLTVDRAYVDLGSLSWSVISAQNSIFGATVNGLKTYSYGNTPDMLCSIYKTAPSSYNDPYISVNGIIWTYVGVSAIRIKDTAYSDATAFKTAMNGVQLVYELATPITIQLTPTQVKSLLGVNNIWADTGDVLDAEYIRDATTIINSLIARIEALENQ